MKNTIIYLIGFPGTGKLTTAKAICAQADFKLVDNHLINNPVFTVIHRDGITPFPSEVWEQTTQIRQIVLNTIKTVSPPDYSFVFTNVLYDNDPKEQEIYNAVKDAADAREATFAPIRLTCELEENMRRINQPDRKENMKEMSEEAARKIRATESLISINHPNFLELDVTDSPAEQTARTILDHARSLVDSES